MTKSNRPILFLSAAVVLGILFANDVIAADDAFIELGCFDGSAPESAGSYHRCFTLYSKTTASWHDAESNCTHNGHNGLALVDASDIEAVISRKLVEMEASVEDDDGYNVWIGGHELENNWTGLTGEKFDYALAESANLAVAFSNQSRDYQNCAVLKTERNALSVASSVCRTTSTRFICQQESGEEYSSGVGSCTIEGTQGLRLNQTCYVLVIVNPPGVSWFEARSRCHMMGATLASIHLSNLPSTAEHLVKFLSSTSNGTDVVDQFWIGLVRHEWIWVTSYQPETRSIARSAPMSFTNWLVDQPNKEVQDCLMTGAVNGHYGWSDESCDVHLPYICETRTIITTTTTTTTTTTITTTTTTTANITDTTDTAPSVKWTAVIVVGVLLGAIVILVITAMCCYVIIKRRGYVKQP